MSIPTRRLLLWCSLKFGNGAAQVLNIKWFADHEVNIPERMFSSTEQFTIGSEHYDGLARRPLFNDCGQFVTFHCGHEVVRNNQVKLAVVEKRQRVFSISGFGKTM